MYKDIAIVPYNNYWPEYFANVALHLHNILGKKCVEVHHIGSTAVPYLSAKNTIDILLVCDELADSLVLKDHGYIFKGELNIPLRYFFSCNRYQFKINLHVCPVDHGFIGLNLYFRDLLRSNAVIRNSYSTLKYSLSRDPNIGQRLRGVFTRYNLQKNEFIKAVLAKSNFQELDVVFCMHDTEWDVYGRMSGEVISSSKRLVGGDCRDDVRYFCLYRGANIVATACVIDIFQNHQIKIYMSPDCLDAVQYYEFLQSKITIWINHYRRYHA